MEYLGKGEMLINWDVNSFVPKVERNNMFVRVEHFWDLLFQLMKLGTNTLHVAFIFLFSVVWAVLCSRNRIECFTF